MMEPAREELAAAIEQPLSLLLFVHQNVTANTVSDPTE
jgi:hypothetical protein